MKNETILVSVLWIGSGVGCTGSEEPDTPSHARPAAAERRTPAERGLIIGAPSATMNFSGTGGGGSGQTLMIRNELHGLLQHYRRSFSHARENSVVRTIGIQFQRLQPYLIEILEIEDHPLILEAIGVSGSLGQQILRPHLTHLARINSGKVGVAALLAAEKIELWSLSELNDFLDLDQDKPIILAALRAVRDRDYKIHDIPNFSIVRLFEREDAEIRASALETLPVELTSTARDQLLHNMDHGLPEVARLSMRALCKSGVDRIKERALVAALESSSRVNRVLALNLLATKKKRLVYPDKVWNPSMAETTEDVEHSLALYCLERTRSAKLPRIRSRVSTMNPLPRYFAARCFVAAGDKHGIAILLDLLESVEREQVFGTEAPDEREAERLEGKDIGDPAETTDPVQAGAPAAETKNGKAPATQPRTTITGEMLLVAIRKLLGRLSRTGQFAKQEAWVQWYRDLDRLPKCDLGPRVLDLE